VRSGGPALAGVVFRICCRAPLPLASDLPDVPLQTGTLIADAGSGFAARLKRAGQPKFEQSAIVLLQPHLLGVEPRGVALGRHRFCCCLAQGNILRSRDAIRARVWQPQTFAVVIARSGSDEAIQN